MSDQAICDHCNGNGSTIGFACPGFRPVVMPCRICGQTGKLTEDDLARVAAGKAMREDRIARNLSLREEAKRLGISPEKLWAQERGLKP